VIPMLGSLPLANLRPAHIQSLYGRALSDRGWLDGKEGGLSARSVLHLHRVLRQRPRPLLPAGAGGGDSARGQQVFTTSCNACHPGGRQGVGPTLAGVTSKLSDTRTIQVVRQGSGGMPAVGASFSDQQLADLLAYLKTL